MPQVPAGDMFDAAPLPKVAKEPAERHGAVIEPVHAWYRMNADGGMTACLLKVERDIDGKWPIAATWERGITCSEVPADPARGGRIDKRRR